MWLLGAPAPACAQISDNVVKIGILTDMSGPFRDLAGPGSLVAAQLAAEDVGNTVLGKPIEIVAADTELKPDLASARVREWFDVDHVDMINELTGSTIALAVSQLARDKNKIAIANSAPVMALTGQQCSPNTIQYSYDVYSLVGAVTTATVKAGGKSWFFITQDSAGGSSLEDTVTSFLTAAGGHKVGSVRHPINTQEFSSFLLQAQASKADVIALANSGSEFINTMKSAQEFGIAQSAQRMIGTNVFITDVNALGLDVAKGLTFATSFYWDFDDQTRAFAKRFFDKMKKMPTMAQAGTYSSTKLYLKAIAEAGTDETQAVLAKMREIPVDDIFKNGRLRADGSFMHDMYVMQVKTPAESKAPWDYYKVLEVVPAVKAYQPLEQSACPLLK